jgi:hypothetical protein
MLKQPKEVHAFGLPPFSLFFDCLATVVAPLHCKAVSISETSESRIRSSHCAQELNKSFRGSISCGKAIETMSSPRLIRGSLLMDSKSRSSSSAS